MSNIDKLKSKGTSKIVWAVVICAFTLELAFAAPLAYLAVVAGSVLLAKKGYNQIKEAESKGRMEEFNRISKSNFDEEDYKVNFDSFKKSTKEKEEKASQYKMNMTSILSELEKKEYEFINLKRDYNRQTQNGALELDERALENLRYEAHKIMNEYGYIEEQIRGLLSPKQEKLFRERTYEFINWSNENLKTDMTSVYSNGVLRCCRFNYRDESYDGVANDSVTNRGIGLYGIDYGNGYVEAITGLPLEKINYESYRTDCIYYESLKEVSKEEMDEALKNVRIYSEEMEEYKKFIYALVCRQAASQRELDDIKRRQKMNGIYN